MANPIINQTHKGDTLFWQDSNGGIPEQAILILPSDGVITLQQADHFVNLNVDTLPAFIKALQAIYKNL